MPHELENPVVVDFPLRGQTWMAVTTPATRVPSHGTDILGQRYAFDLLKVDGRRGVNFHPTTQLRGLFLGGATRDCYAWGASIHAPFDGEVVRASDGMPERAWIHPIGEAARMIRNGLTFEPSKIPSIMGNHVLLRSTGGLGGRSGTGTGAVSGTGTGTGTGTVYAGFAHLAPGSVAVVAGQHVAAGDLLGRVGHTGNSTSPHLHFQLMDSPDLMSARGIPCAFREYEVERDGEWVRVRNGIPGQRDRIRSV